RVFPGCSHGHRSSHESHLTCCQLPPHPGGTSTRAYPGKEDDDRVALAQIAAKGGPGVKAAASQALDGTAADVARFVQTGQYQAQQDDDRVGVTEALANGGPEVQAAAQAVLSGPPSRLRPFLEVGVYKARQRDANAAAHIAEVSTLLSATYKSAWLAQKDAAEAQKVAAQARKDAQKAIEASDKAQHSADTANTYAEQADKSADQAAKSAESAAQSAKTARAAAASAQHDAQSATSSAISAQHSAGVAQHYAYEADTAAFDAGLSAAAAGKDAAAAANASSEAMKAAADKLVAELKTQVKKELQEASKPVTDEDLRNALEKRLVMYRGDLLENGDLKPGETLLVCGGDGAGGMGCITSTYLDRLIAWYVGADEIEACLHDTKPSCFSGLALAALKLKVLRKLPCEKNSFAPGTRVLLGDGRTKAIEDIRVGEKVLATDPVSGRTQSEPVQATITGWGEKSLVKLTVAAKKPGRDGTVTATARHPFWLPDARAWNNAESLPPGTRLTTPTGARTQVTAVKSWTAPNQRVHNLTIADLHTYYVMAGKTPVLVHNSGCPIGFTADTVEDAFTGMNKGGGHAIRYLIKEGLIPNKGSVASQVKYFQENFSQILTAPEKSFDWKIGGTQARGFAKRINGKVVVVFVAKEGQYAGKILSSVVPGAKNMTKWDLW
ncbi:polymorphic toxin-type HINT domain-containing protein, partial [Streptomyces sp. NPDC005244]|uniref:polymorphic toxin-type HINT domain-containing protein n=1 Tax=Streptomyces sp. NPDC005244 TaxID=3364708 RepID=UPI003674F6E7